MLFRSQKTDRSPDMHLEVRQRRKARFRRLGTALVVALVTLLVIASLLGTLVQSLLAQSRQSRQVANQLQANWLADTALARPRCIPIAAPLGGKE